MRVCVYGASSSLIDGIYEKKCYEMGGTLAKRGHSLVFGAGAEGLMGASARGFKDGGAHIIGVIPEFFEENGYEAIYKQADELIYTKTMAERKAIMEDKCEAFIIVPGGMGTFEEFYQVLTLKQLGRHNKPIVIYNIENYYDNMNKFFLECVQKKFIRKECEKLYFTTNDLNRLIDYIENYTGEGIEWSILKKNKM